MTKKPHLKIANDMFSKTSFIAPSNKDVLIRCCYALVKKIRLWRLEREPNPSQPHLLFFPDLIFKGEIEVVVGGGDDSLACVFYFPEGGNWKRPECNTLHPYDQNCLVIL